MSITLEIFEDIFTEEPDSDETIESIAVMVNEYLTGLRAEGISEEEIQHDIMLFDSAITSGAYPLYAHLGNVNWPIVINDPKLRAEGKKNYNEVVRGFNNV